MTAEVVLVNKSAAVLAADSAVTISGDYGAKTYNSASKIAALSYDPPIGALVYGDSEILGIPWESIKRMYSDEFRGGNHPKDTVANVADDFFAWIDNQADWLFRQLEERRAVESADQSLDRVFVAVGQRADNVTPDDAAIAYVDAELRSSEVDPQAALQRQETLGLFAGIFDARMSAHQLRGLALADATWQRIGDLAAETLRRRSLSQGSVGRSGVAFAGIGSRQFHPELVVYNVRGVLNSSIVCDKDPRKSDAEGAPPARIVPLGQAEIVEAFLGGSQPKYQAVADQIVGGLGETVTTLVLSVLRSQGVEAAAYGDALKNAVTAAIDSALGRLEQKRAESARSIQDMIANLPTPELVAAAEALVSLSALRQRIGPDLETVGLPVDVAVASKIEGFVWVRRKRYFSLDLNPELYYRRS
jgi:hypothetical protein